MCSPLSNKGIREEIFQPLAEKYYRLYISNALSLFHESLQGVAPCVQSIDWKEEGNPWDRVAVIKFTYEHYDEVVARLDSCASRFLFVRCTTRDTAENLEVNFSLDRTYATYETVLEFLRSPTATFNMEDNNYLIDHCPLLKQLSIEEN